MFEVMRRRAPAVLACVATTAVAGCGGGDDEAPERATTEARPPAAATTAPAPPASPEPAAAPDGRRVRFAASDGVRLTGTLVPARSRPAPGVVLVHEANAGPEQWRPFVAYLHAAGYTTLAYRSRTRRRLDETVNSRDVAGAIRALRRQPNVDPERIGLVGASIGASSVSYFAFRPAARTVDAIVGLSPSPFLDDPPAAPAPRDVLLIADLGERGEADLIAAAAPAIEVRTAPVTGHGIALLDDARVRQAVLDWLAERLAGR